LNSTYKKTLEDLQGDVKFVWQKDLFAGNYLAIYLYTDILSHIVKVIKVKMSSQIRIATCSMRLQYRTRIAYRELAFEFS